MVKTRGNPSPTFIAMSHQFSCSLAIGLAVAPHSARLRNVPFSHPAEARTTAESAMSRASTAIDLTTLLLTAQSRLKATLGNQVTLELDVEPDLPRVGADAAKVEDLLLKLAKTLIRRAPARPSVLMLGLGLRELDAATLEGNRTARLLAPGTYLTLQLSSRLEVAPNGDTTPVDPDLSQIIPSLETQGAGLLVATGNSGTTVRMLFPAVAQQTGPVLSGAASWSPDSRRVLLADDDEAVRLIAARVLQLLKFEVTVAVDGEDALRQFQNSPGPFRAVMLDISMPNLDGIVAAREIRRICPAQPIVFISGDASDEVVRRLPGGVATGVIQEPFSAAGICSTLEHCVASPS